MRHLICCTVLLLWIPLVSGADGLTGTPADECHRAAAAASAKWGVPHDVLRAIALAETGRSSEDGFHPWPWALNPGGAGTWYPSRDAALRAAQAHRAAGRSNLDLGCFQINYRWHHQAFDDLAEMLDPVANADYAARFLSDLFSEFGHWGKAAAAYHSRTPEHAARYRTRFERILAGLGTAPDLGSYQVAEIRTPRPWPLAAEDGQSTAGSLARIANGATVTLWSDAPRQAILW